jgi:cytoskeletal protein CcmA (bactofilin family)
MCVCRRFLPFFIAPIKNIFDTGYNLVATVAAGAHIEAGCHKTHGQSQGYIEHGAQGSVRVMSGCCNMKRIQATNIRVMSGCIGAAT